MLVFGESILNDAVAIVLTNVIVESKHHIINIDTNKLKTVSMIGLLASSNLTTILTPKHRAENELIKHNEHQAMLNHGGNQ